MKSEYNLMLDITTNKCGYALFDRHNKLVKYGKLDYKKREIEVDLKNGKKVKRKVDWEGNTPLVLLQKANFVYNETFEIANSIWDEDICVHIENSHLFKNNWQKEFIGMLMTELVFQVKDIKYLEAARWTSLAKKKVLWYNSVKPIDNLNEILTTKKGVSIWLANKIYGLDLTKKDDDIADAINMYLALENNPERFNTKK